MTRRRTIATAAAIAVALVTAAVLWATLRDTYEDKVRACTEAVRADWGSGKKLADDRPTGCADIKDDDYTTILVDAAVRESDLGDALNVE